MQIDCSDPGNRRPVTPEEAAMLAGLLEQDAETFGPHADNLLYAGRIDDAVLLARGLEASAEIAAGIRTALDDQRAVSGPEGGTP